MFAFSDTYSDTYERSWDFCELPSGNLGRPFHVDEARNAVNESERNCTENKEIDNQKETICVSTSSEGNQEVFGQKEHYKECSFMRFKKACHEEEFYTTYTVEILTEAETNSLIDAWKCILEEPYSSLLAMETTGMPSTTAVTEVAHADVLELTDSKTTGTQGDPVQLRQTS